MLVLISTRVKDNSKCPESKYCVKRQLILYLFADVEAYVK
jgi:hypothetical protein